MRTHHVMLDLETLGTKPGCKILSIGASVFNGPDELKDKYFYAVIDPDSQDLMDTQDPATMAWWNEQSAEARDAVFNNKYAGNLVGVLKLFNTFLENLKDSPEERIIIWGNGATFDEPIIKEAMKRYEIEPAWTFRDSMCFRTLKELGKMWGIEEPDFTGVKHNALADAAHQAKWADKILSVVYTSLREQTGYRPLP